MVAQPSIALSAPLAGASSGRRLVSLDALRGFDMLWIVGGREVLVALAEGSDSSVLRWMASQTEHVPWNGFTFWDLIFPLFLFIAGVAMPFSFAARMERGDTRARLRMHVVRRGLVLVGLGLVYNGLLTFDFAHLRCASVLGRIGLAYLFAGLIFLGTTPRGQVLWTVGILLGYWAALAWVPVPGVGVGAGVLEPGKTLADHLDRLFLPGRLYHGDRDPEGLLSTVPAIATALAGGLAGHWLRGAASGLRKAGGLLLAGLACLGLGGLWQLVLPLNKNLWTSSFVMWTAGWSLLLLGVFFLVIDVWELRRWSFFLVVVGANAITIYLLNAFVDFQGLTDLVLARGTARLHPALFALAGLLLRWSLLQVLYRRRIFLRV